MRSLVAKDFVVHGYENQPFHLRLSHQEPVKWVTMHLWKRPCPLRLLDGNGQSRETMVINGLSPMPARRSAFPTPV